GPAGGPSMNTTTIPGADTVGPVARWRALADFDWKPIALVPALMALALPAIGSGSTWLTLTVAGLAMGLIVFIIASGLTLVFGLMDVLNFGHGVFIALGAFVAVSVLAPMGGLTGSASMAANLVAVGAALPGGAAVAGAPGS